MSNTSIDRIKSKYESRIHAFLKDVAEVARKNGLKTTGEIDDEGYEDYTFSLFVQPAGARDSRKGAEVKITLAESEHWDGTPGGVNFMLDVDGPDDKIGGIIPYNYTDDVWVRRSKVDAIERRFREFINVADSNEIVESIAEHFSKKKRKSASGR